MLYQVVHSTLGRCRIRVPRLADDLEFAQTLSGLLESLQFVTEVRINPAASSLIVSYKASAVKSRNVQEHLLTCIERASCIQQANLIEASPETESEESDLILEINQWKDLGLPLLSLSVAIAAVPLELPPLLVGVAIAAAAMPWFNRAADSIINHHHPNIDLLDSVWMTLQTLQGQYVAPALKTSLVEIRRTLRGTVVQGREQEAFEVLNCLNRDVWVERNGFEQAIPARDLHVGDRIMVHAGELIPVDGEIISGTGLVNCCYLTGVATPVSCSQGQEVYASSLLVEGELSILVKRTGDNTRIKAIAHLMQSAPVHDTQIGAHQAEFVKNAILPTLVLGGTIFAATGNLGAAISPFQFDFGSGIPISISTTILCALTHAARNGVYIKSGRALEVLAQMDTIVIDCSVLLNAIPLDSVRAIATFQKQGIAIYLISADSLEQTIALAEKFGIHRDHILSEAHPQQQAHLIRGLQSQGKTVAVVGDSNYCSVALACGDIPVSLACVGDISKETADVVLLNRQLRFLTYGKAIAKRAMEVLYQNTATIVVPNLMMQIVGGMVLGVHPVWNVIVNNGSAFIAEFLNTSRLIFDSVTLPPEQDNLGDNSIPGVLAIPPSPTDFPLPILNGKKPQKEQLIEVYPVIYTTSINHAVQSKDVHITQISSEILLNSEPNLLESSEPCYPPTLKQNELAKRLGLTSQALTQYRLKPDFREWSKAKDPDGIAWTYEAVSKSFHPIKLPLSETAGGKIGETVGEIVGEVLLGEEGKAIGEEIGEKIGSAVGEMLGEDVTAIAKFGDPESGQK
ncbi:MAG: HMA2 domain-containing protein [Heteroscytonema crispum UTEX LB 1556]